MGRGQLAGQAMEIARQPAAAIGTPPSLSRDDRSFHLLRPDADMKIGGSLKRSPSLPTPVSTPAFPGF